MNGLYSESYKVSTYFSHIGSTKKSGWPESSKRIVHWQQNKADRYICRDSEPRKLYAMTFPRERERHTQCSESNRWNGCIAMTCPYSIMILPHDAVSPQEWERLKYRWSFSRPSVCLEIISKRGGIDVEKKLLQYSMQIAMLNQLLARKMITEKEYAQIKLKLMQDYNIISDITA